MPGNSFSRIVSFYMQQHCCSEATHWCFNKLLTCFQHFYPAGFSVQYFRVRKRWVAPTAQLPCFIYAALFEVRHTHTQKKKNDSISKKHKKTQTANTAHFNWTVFKSKVSCRSVWFVKKCDGSSRNIQGHGDRNYLWCHTKAPTSISVNNKTSLHSETILLVHKQ